LEDGAANLVYTFTRAGVLTGALNVNFNVSGNAVFGADYSQTGAGAFSVTAGTVTFAAGSATAVVTLNPATDPAVEPDETAVLTVVAGTGYTVGVPATATGTIQNDDVAGPPVLTPIPEQSMFGDDVLNVPLNVTDPDTPAAGLTYSATADDAGYLLDQSLNLVNYFPEFDNFGGLGDKWLTDSAGQWYFIHLDGGTGLAKLRRWQEDPVLTDDPVVGVLHRIYYDQPAARLVSPVSIAFTPATSSVPAQVTLDPANSFVGTLRVGVMVSDGSGSDSESFSAHVDPAIDLSPIAGQAMFNDGALIVPLAATDHNTPPGNLIYTATADDYGFVLDQMLNLVSYHPNFDNYFGAGEKWLRDAVGGWFLLVVDGAGTASLRRWDGGAIVADDTLVAELHRVYYDDPLARLVNPTSIVFTAATGNSPAQVTVNPPNTFLGTLRVHVTVSDGTNSDSEACSVEVTQGIDLAPIPNQALLNNAVLDVPLTATDPDTPPAGLSFIATADDYGFLLDQMLNLASYHPNFDNYYGVGDKWLKDGSGVWYLIHLDAGTGRAYLRRWDGGALITDDTLVAELHPAYYADPVGRLVNTVSIAFSPATNSIPARVTIDPPDAFVGTLRVNVTVSDGPHSDAESFSVQVNASGGSTSLASAALAGERRTSRATVRSTPQSAAALSSAFAADFAVRRHYRQAVDEIFESFDALTEDDRGAILPASDAEAAEVRSSRSAARLTGERGA
jgi:hypothetical protein